MCMHTRPIEATRQNWARGMLQQVRPLWRVSLTSNPAIQVIHAPTAARQTSLPVVLRPCDVRMKTTASYLSYQS